MVPTLHPPGTVKKTTVLPCGQYFVLGVGAIEHSYHGLISPFDGDPTRPGAGAGQSGTALRLVSVSRYRHVCRSVVLSVHV